MQSPPNSVCLKLGESPTYKKEENADIPPAAMENIVSEIRPKSNV